MTLTTVPARAAEWIAGFLNNHEVFSSKSHFPFMVQDLTHLSVKELKCVSKELEKQVSIANCSPTSSAVFYSKPTLSSRKAEWVSSVANACASEDILNIIAPNDPGVVAVPAAGNRVNQSTADNGIASKREEAAAESRSPKKTPGKKQSPKSKKSSPANGSKQHHNSAAKKSSAKKHSTNNNSNNSATESDAAGMFPPAASFAAPAYQNQLGGNYPLAAAASFIPPHPANTYTAGSKRPHSTDNTTQPSISKVKVKKEPRSFTPPSLDDSIQPRDYRESAMVQSLRNMGFEDTREMLSGIRATSAQEVGSVFMPNQWDQTQQVEAAMMWIVNQREEAAEARKLDEARVSSENANRAMVESRREEEKRRMKYAALNDLFGSMEGGSTTSKHFPSSVLLKNAEVRKVLHAIGTGPGKDQGVKLLQLESKAIKWYGTVLPIAYLKYVVSPRFEKWSKEFIISSKKLNSASESMLLQKVAYESKELEEGMFNLSEQEMGSFGMAPKLFLAAQKAAEARGQSVCDFLDDDLIVVSAQSSAPRPAIKERKEGVEIIDLS